MQKGTGKDAWVLLFQMQLHSSSDPVILKDVGVGFFFHSLCCLFSAALKPGSILGKSSQTVYLNCNGRVLLKISCSICDERHFSSFFLKKRSTYRRTQSETLQFHFFALG